MRLQRIFCPLAVKQKAIAPFTTMVNGAQTALPHKTSARPPPIIAAGTAKPGGKREAAKKINAKMQVGGVAANGDGYME